MSDCLLVRRRQFIHSLETFMLAFSHNRKKKEERIRTEIVGMEEPHSNNSSLRFFSYLLQLAHEKFVRLSSTFQVWSMSVAVFCVCFGGLDFLLWSVEFGDMFGKEWRNIPLNGLESALGNACIWFSKNVILHTRLFRRW